MRLKAHSLMIPVTLFHFPRVNFVILFTHTRTVKTHVCSTLSRMIMRLL